MVELKDCAVLAIALVDGCENGLLNHKESHG